MCFDNEVNVGADSHQSKSVCVFSIWYLNQSDKICILPPNLLYESNLQMTQINWRSTNPQNVQNPWDSAHGRSNKALIDRLIDISAC